MSGCRRPDCGPACLASAGAQAGRTQQVARGLAAVSAVTAGVLLIAAATSMPGYRRSRRGPWAVEHAARWVLRAVGIRVVVHGKPRSGPSLVVGNHSSWLDILVLAGCAPLVMVAKSEVRGWPVIGGAAVRAGTIFLQRNSWRALPGTVEQITAALRSGLRVQVFPEATTRCGSALGEFHRAAFQAAIDAAVVISPVTIAYAQDGRSAATAGAFLGDESLVDSLRRVVAARDLQITVRWLPPIPAIAGTGRDHLDRATVTRLTENAVAADLAVPIVRRGQRRGVAALPLTEGPAALPSAPGPVSSQRARPVAPR
jgi:1-acyl-sn-glycerol-3-phosphate acyltransferase